MYRQIIVIDGCSGSGKSSYTRLMAEQLDGVIISLDNYINPTNVTAEQALTFNFDNPEVYDLKLFKIQIEDIINSYNQKDISIKIPLYNFNIHQRDSFKIIEIKKDQPIIIEGIFTFYATAFIDKKFKIFINTEFEVCKQRRIDRDTKERGRDLRDVLYRWNNHVIPGTHKYILPQSKEADLKIDNSNVKTTKNMLFEMENIVKKLKSNGKTRFDI